MNLDEHAINGKCKKNTQGKTRIDIFLNHIAQSKSIKTVLTNDNKTVSVAENVQTIFNVAVTR